MAYIDPTIAKTYRDRRRSIKAAFDTAFGTQEQLAGAQIQALGGQYDQLRGQAYTGARLSALGNNEVMAAQGLAGAPMAGPLSGYSETSRARQDTALGGALNAISLQQQGAVNDINTQISAGRLERDANWLNQRSALLGEEQQAQDQAYQVALQKAQDEVSMFGKVMTPESARVLGVPVGTRMRGAGGGGGPKQEKYTPTAAELAKADALGLAWNGTMWVVKDTPKPKPKLDEGAYAGMYYQGGNDPRNPNRNK